METTILYHQKRKPPGTNPAARPCLQTRTRFCRFAFTDTRPIIPHETKEPRCLRGSPENTPQNHSPQRKEDANNYRLSVSAVNRKAAGRLIPDCLQTPTQPPMRLVDTSKCWLRPLQTPKQAQPPQEEVTILYQLALRLVNALRTAIPRRVARSFARSRRPRPRGFPQRWSTQTRWPQAPPKNTQAPNQHRQARC